MEMFHFLRPLWLLAVPLLLLAWWLTRRSDKRDHAAAEIVAPHLRDALTVNRSSRGAFRPVDLTGLIALLIIFAAAGPTWSKQPSPWFAETAPLVVAVEVTDSMRANDVEPTRLDRARFKMLDLITSRTGSRTAIIAYAGSAHIVLPPSTDVNVIKPLLESLDPAIMPVKGANATSVLPLAERLLVDEAAIGTVLFVNDGFDSADVSELIARAKMPGSVSMAVLVVGTDEGGVALLPDGSPVSDPSGGRLDTRVDKSVLDRLSNETDVKVFRMTAGDGDIRQLMQTIESNLQQADDPDSQWHDEGWWLLWPAALLMLPWFRRGWTMQW